MRLKKMMMLVEYRKTLHWYSFAGRDALRPSGRNVYLQCNIDTHLWTHVQVPFRSYVVDLSLDEEKRQAGYAAKLRQNIRAAQRLQLHIQRGQNHAEFSELYRATAAQHNLTGGTIGHLATKPNLLISFIYHPTHGLLAAHANLLDTETGIVKLEYNASNYRAFSSGSGIRNQCGQANALLFDADFRFFAEQGFQRYDFGGYDEDDGLRQFKMQFGGTVAQQFNYFPVWYHAYRKLRTR